jgi:two-component system, NtrC family, sensor kinase
MNLDKLKLFFQMRSISFRLHLFIIVTIVLALLAVSYLDSQVSTQLMDSEIEQNATGATYQIAEDLSQKEAPTNAAAIQTWLRKTMESEPYIIRIDIYRQTEGGVTRFVTTSSMDSHPLAIDETAAINNSKSVSLPLFQDRERFQKIVVPFTDPNGSKSCVTLIVSLRQSDLVRRIHGRIAYFLVPGSVLVSLLLLHFLFTRLLMRRFGRLIAAMNAAKSGDLKIRAPIEHPDEIGTIARRYNEMMDEIELASRERDRLLQEQKSFNIKLQEKVREATQVLSATNEKLSQVNEDLVDAQRRLTQSERAAVVGQMAATFAHEIGSPLSAMSTHLQLMAEDAGISEDARRRLQLIQDQVSRITGFVEELLSETRGALKTRTRVQLNQILQQLLLFLEQHLARCRVRVESRLSPALPEIEANPQQLQQVFLNLLNNACDAMPEGGTVVVETTTKTEGNNEFVVTIVGDNGTGIPEEKQKHIFEPFFTTKDLQRGTGLGLSIAAKIIRQHQGTIDLHSVPGEGALFTICFPVPQRHSADTTGWEDTSTTVPSNSMDTDTLSPAKR